MEPSDVKNAVLRDLGLTIEPRMSEYVSRKLAAGTTGPLAIIGGDARTGVPRREMVDLKQLKPR